MVAIWPFDWLVELKVSMQALSPKNNPQGICMDSAFPGNPQGSQIGWPEPASLKGPEAVKLIISSEFC